MKRNEILLQRIFLFNFIEDRRELIDSKRQVILFKQDLSAQDDYKFEIRSMKSETNPNVELPKFEKF